jgi:hypothetical protein
MSYSKHFTACIDYLYSRDLFDNFSDMKVEEKFINEKYIPYDRVSFDFITEIEKLLNTEDTDIIGNFLFELYQCVITPIIETDIRLGDTLFIRDDLSKCEILVDQVSSAKFSTRSICPIIKTENEPYFNLVQSTPFPIFHGKTNSNALGSLWFTFRYYMNSETLGANSIGLYLDNEEEGHCLWCGGAGIKTISFF